MCDVTACVNAVNMLHDVFSGASAEQYHYLADNSYSILPLMFL